MGAGRFGVVIVGAGHGGAQAAIALRHHGFEGSILMIGRDPEPPYERPALSKEYLAREKPFERMLIRPPHFWPEKGVELKLGDTVVAVDPATKTLSLQSSETVAYEHLIWAAGGDPRRLTCDGADLGGVHAVRDKSDVDRIMSEIDAGASNVVVIGGGYIGLEAAAVLTKLGCEVTLLEALPRVLARVCGENLSQFYQAEHRAHGVDLRVSTKVTGIEGGSRATGVRLSDGQMVPCELVIVGIGIVPAVAPLLKAGASGGNGVDVDEHCRTSLPGVYAVGDCASHVSRYAGGKLIRLESVQNAADMASTAARHICGKPEPYSALPWFWSNQYDLKLQTVGLSMDHEATVTRGDPDSRSFSIVYLKDYRIIALDCVNAVKDYVQGRKLVESMATVDIDSVADARVPLKDLLANETPARAG